MMAWQAMRTLATVGATDPGAAVKPVDLHRSGFALGESAAFLVLERAEQVGARGARAYSMLRWFGPDCDATPLTNLDAAGQARALCDAAECEPLASV